LIRRSAETSARPPIRPPRQPGRSPRGCRARSISKTRNTRSTREVMRVNGIHDCLRVGPISNAKYRRLQHLGPQFLDFGSEAAVRDSGLGAGCAAQPWSATLADPVLQRLAMRIQLPSQLRDYRLRIGLTIEPPRALTQLDRILPVRCHCKPPSPGLQDQTLSESLRTGGKRTPSASTRGRRRS
jgi:hypothetical protein